MPFGSISSVARKDVAMATTKGALRRSGNETIKPAPKVVHSRERRSQVTSEEGTVAKRSLEAKAAAKKRPKRRGAGPVTPYLTVADATASLAFYAQAFGFKPGVTISAADSRIIHAVMHCGHAVAVMFSPEGTWSGSMKAPAHSGAENPITMYVPRFKVDALTERARAAGATILTEPADMFWGNRIARIADPDGYVWCFASKTGKFDPAKMPPVADESADFDLDIQL
jgi:uncharacterized glyoxalase superfamily protein PhnB